MADITEYETEQIDRANASGKTPVAFIHGLWLLPSSWDRWRTVFEEAGYTTLPSELREISQRLVDVRRHLERLSGQRPTS